MLRDYPGIFFYNCVLALLPVGVDHWLMLVGTGKSETQTLDMRPVVGEGHFSV